MIPLHHLPMEIPTTGKYEVAMLAKGKGLRHLRFAANGAALPQEGADAVLEGDAHGKLAWLWAWPLKVSQPQ